jgi:hypothetical protein
VTETIFGPLIGPYTLEQQIVAVYRIWTSEYLAQIELQGGLQARTIPRPPTPESFHGGLDFLSWKGTELPKVIVVVEPTGQPERDASVGYSQKYEVKVGCIVVGLGAGTIAEPSPEPEDEVRALASYYGAMSMLLVDQPPALASDIEMVETPRLSFPDTENRRICQSNTAFHVWVAPIKLLAAGPTEPNPREAPQYPGTPEEEWGQDPTVTKRTVTLTAEDI